MNHIVKTSLLGDVLPDREGGQKLWEILMHPAFPCDQGFTKLRKPVSGMWILSPVVGASPGGTTRQCSGLNISDICFGQVSPHFSICLVIIQVASFVTLSIIAEMEVWFVDAQSLTDTGRMSSHILLYTVCTVGCLLHCGLGVSRHSFRIMENLTDLDTVKQYYQK